MHIPSPVSAAIGAVLVAVASCATPAHATRVTAQATAICQGALPAFETAIRKRPLAVQNEGTTNAFVTCSFVNPGITVGTTQILSASVQLQNLHQETQRVFCTAVSSDAVPAPVPPLYLTKSVFVTPSATASTELTFSAQEFQGGQFLLAGNTISVQCNLPPGVGITGTVLVNNA